MSRISALWTAGAVALLFALLVGAVVLRPVLDANAGEQGGNGQTGITDVSSDGAGGEQWWDDDDYDDDEDDDDWDDEYEDDEDEDHDEHEGDDDDDD